MTEREHDIVVFGATGFTGALTAEYLAGTRPRTRAGRSRGATAPSSSRPGGRLRTPTRPGPSLPLLVADVADPASMRALAESTKVVITTVGPYIRYGEPLVAACAAAGTDYVDLTGEPEFVDRMWLRYHEQAVADRRPAGALVRL